MASGLLSSYRHEPGSQRYPPLFRYFYLDRGNFIAFVSNLRSRRMLRRAVSLFASQSDVPVESLASLSIVPGVSWSDHLGGSGLRPALVDGDNSSRRSVQNVRRS